MNRKNDTVVILDAAIEQHKQVLASYERALLNKSLDLRVPVKNAMENLRSALDYMPTILMRLAANPNGRPAANRIRRIFTSPTAERSTTSNRESAVHCLAWMLLLRPFINCSFRSSRLLAMTIGCTNCARSLMKKSTTGLQSRFERKPKLTQFKARTAASLFPLMIRTSKLFHSREPSRSLGFQRNFAKMASTPPLSSGLKHVRTTWVGFTFAGTEVNVIDLLNKTVTGAKKFSDDLYKLI